METAELQSLCKEIRKDIINMIYNAGSGHPGGSLSATEIMTVLFFDVMNHDPTNPEDPNRDRFVLSKGHCTPVYYSVLAHAGYFPIDELKTFRKLNSRLQGHPDKSKFPLMESSTGSLGQGLSVAAGIAFGLQLDKNPAKVYCMIGDGELDEGQIWESLATIHKYQLSNLIIILDNNKVQLDGSNAEIKNMEPLREKLLAFNFGVLNVNGHDIDAVCKTFADAKQLSDGGKNVIIMAGTVKGKGVSFMENTCEWHGKAPNKEQYEMAMRELNG
jgi:transketolase